MDYFSNGLPAGGSYSPKRIDDNQKHTIEIILESNVIKLIVDNMGNMGQDVYLINYPSGNIFIGGLNRFPFNGKYRNGFYGCIHSMTVSYVS